MRISLLAIAGLLALVSVPSMAGAQATKIGVIKPAKVFQDMQETKELKAKMESEGRTLKQVGDEKGEKLRKLQAELQQLKYGSTAFSEKNRELRMAQIEAESWQKVTQADLENSEKQMTLTLFRKIETAIADVSKAKGIELVIADVAGDLPESVEGVNKQQFTTFLSQKNVWYTAGAADITTDVLTKLDADFKAGEKK
jgi:Skp family chaperone for outer membrane proteins